MATPRLSKTPPCSVQSCERHSWARGWCGKHYQRWHRYGDPEPQGLRIVGDVEAQFWAKVNKNGPTPKIRAELGPCWLWTSNPTSAGYGQFRAEGRHVSAHRWGYIRFVGDPGSLHLDHLCRERMCVNPSHLEPVTPRENTKRAWVSLMTDQELLAEVERRGL